MKKINSIVSLLSTTLFVLLFLGLSALPARAQITGLSEWSIFLDPGHSQTENMGLYGYSEAEKVLRVALNLRDMLVQQTDISEVHLSRLTDQDYITLAGRTDLANSLGVDFYYSIHSDAAGNAAANSTLFMYGGWRKDGVTIEKTPAGGADFGAILNPHLTGAMRIGTRGLYADRVFYLGNVDTHENQWPYLHVNRTTNMASLLSEGGFHTNPTQQQRNLNGEWKKLEATAAFRAILEFKGIDRPAIGVATGIITDVENGVPVNGATVTIGDKQYVTDSFESLFNQYSNDPDKLHNGFYWIEGLTPGEEVTVAFTHPDFESKTVDLTIVSNPNATTADNFSFLDMELINTLPPVVSLVEAADGLDQVIPGNAVTIVFSRKMERISVESALTISPEKPLTFTWDDDYRLNVFADALDYGTEYTVTIDGSLARNSLTNQFLDGDADGTEGGNYQFTFTTAPPDDTPPKLVDFSPSSTVPTPEVRPVIRLVYDEEIMTASVAADAVTLTPVGGGTAITGVVHAALVDGQTVIHLFPTQDLASTGTYRVDISAGLEDQFGNATAAESFEFQVQEKPITASTIIDDFNAGITGWWQPQQSGSTDGIISEETGWVPETDIVCTSVGSTGSMKLSYAWDMGAAGTKYLRVHLPEDALQNNNKFGPEHVLQTWLFGDGSGNQFRFVIRDGTGNYESSQWFTLDWIGWKLVSWDLVNDPVYGWVNGNGVLDGTGFTVEGFHVRYYALSTKKNSGTLYFDNLRFVVRDQNPVSVPGVSSQEFRVYPNPVKDVLHIESPQPASELRIYDLAGRLVLSRKAGGGLSTVNVAQLKAGWYVVQAKVGDQLVSAKIRVVK